MRKFFVGTSSLVFTVAVSLVCLTASRAPAAITLTNLFSFGINYTNSDGLAPSSGLVQAKDGSLYGVTSDGGDQGLGTVFKITTNGVYTSLVSFTGANGANPAGVLVQTADGNFYGTTTYGGIYDLGTIFRMSPAGVLAVIATFNGTNGANPMAGLVLAANGLLYGTAQYGGANDADFGGDGTVFKMTTNGVVTVVYSFANGTDGANPVAAVIQGKDGNFYGATPYGGADFSGTVFKLTAGGTLTTLHTFTGGADGGVPDGQLVQGKDGGLYGTTAYGGTNDVDLGGDGTVFRITTAGSLARLVSFNNTNGNDPEAALVQTSDGTLYGTTAYGGVNGDGVAFKVTTNGVFTGLLSFDGANGAQPFSTCVLGTDGILYGTTSASGLNKVPGGNGTVFKITTNGALNTLYFFGDSNPNGSTPLARLVLGADGNYYGTTVYGGTNSGGFGTVFRLATNGDQRTIFSFAGTNGAYPRAALVLAADGSFYGTTAYGGTNDARNGGDGTFFKITTNGILTALASFAGTNGANPAGELVLGPDGSYYGTTRNGGTNNVASGGSGAIFRVTTSGMITLLASFAVTNGSHPLTALALGPDGNFYGTTAYGGTNDLANNGDGTVFRVTTNGVLTRLLSFASTNGANPAGTLALGSDGTFYGTTYNGGTSDNGTIFRITTNGLMTLLHSFSGVNDGANPDAGLVLGSDGNFYGTTSGGGRNFNGTIFQITTNGTFTVVYSFATGLEGESPVAGLVEGAPNHFYGTTESGGINNLGTAFHLFVDPFPSIITPPGDVTVFAGASASFTVSALGAAPLNYRWQRSSTNLSDQGNIFGSGTATLTLSNLALADAASYAVVVSNFAGVITSAPAVLKVLSPLAPTVSSDDAGDVGINKATFNASANPEGASTTVFFKWGLATNYGSNTTLTNIGSGGDEISVSTVVGGLLPFTTYHYRAVAANGLGTNSGGDVSFITYGARSSVTFTPLLSFNTTNGATPQGSLLSPAGTNLYGTTYEGGANDLGTVYKLATNGALTVLLSFNGTNGSHPAAGVLQTPNGVLYGTTYDGGTNDLVDGGFGTVFKITTNGAFVSIVSFNSTNGANPVSSLILGSDGLLYGTTFGGGTNDAIGGGDGTIFRTTTNGALASLYSFDATNGANPAAGLAPGSGGNFYGATSAGGPDDSGTIFKINTNGIFGLLYAFTGGDDGADPEGALILGADGNYYGTTFSGGTDDSGTIFKVTTNGSLTTLYSFTGDVDGANPSGALVQGADGNFYGTTTSGGPEGFGTVFLVTPAGVLATLVLFDSSSYGANPQAGLVQSADGSFYGVATAGGADDLGTEFRFRLAAAPVILVDPVSQTNFAGTSVSLAVAATGNAPLTYRWRQGTTNLSDSPTISGSSTASITLSNLALTDAGAYSVIVSNSSGVATSGIANLTVVNPFPPAVTTQPATGVGMSNATFNATVNPDGALATVWFRYGVTTNYDHISGLTNVAAGGTLVALALDVAGLSPFTLYHFAAVAGNAAGTNSGADLTFMTPGAGGGVTFTTLAAFADTNGADPVAGLLQAADGTFYGTTYDGGDNGLGTVFKLTGDGKLTTLFSFADTNGANPSAELLLGPDGQLYGTTQNGGLNDVNLGGDGTVFSITTNGVLTSSVSFDGTNGANPVAGMILGADGQFYGTTFAGGTNDFGNGGDGTVYRFATNGTIISVASLDLIVGANPAARLLLGTDGNYYGTASNGGTNDVVSGGDGTIFKLTTNGVLAMLVSFNGTNGSSPVAALVPGPDGSFYGTTENGGTNGGFGTVFKVGTNGILTTLYSFGGGIDGANPQTALVLAPDGNFYGTTTGGGLDDNGTIFKLTPGGLLTTLVLFDFDTFGSAPQGGLLLGADGQLYGVADTGGTNGSGTAFRLSTPAGPPVFQSASLAGGLLTFAWSASGGRTYSLQYRTNLSQTNWITLTNVSAAGSVVSASDAMDLSAQRYYRVVLLP